MLGNEKVTTDQFVQAKSTFTFERLYYYHNKIITYRGRGGVKKHSLMKFALGNYVSPNVELTSTGPRLAQLAEELQPGASSFITLSHKTSSH